MEIIDKYDHEILSYMYDEANDFYKNKNYQVVVNLTKKIIELDKFQFKVFLL